MTLTADQRRARRKALLWLAAVIVVVAVSLSLNRPSSKAVEFDIVCDRFLVPVTLKLNLNRGETQLERIRGYDFEGAIANTASMAPLDPGARERLPVVEALTLGRSSDASVPRPFLDLQPLPGYGKMELDVEKGVLLSSFKTEETAPCLRVESATPGDSRLVLQSDALLLRQNRYVIPEISPSGKPIDSLSVRISAPPPGVLVSVKSGPVRDPLLRLDVTFGKRESDLDLLEFSKQGKAISIGPARLEFYGALNPGLRLEGESAAGRISDHRVDLQMDAESGMIANISIVSRSEKANVPLLRVTGAIDARSLRQSGQELLPTFVQEVMDAPYARRSVWLVLLGFLAFAAFKILDRAIDVLLKLHIPEE